MSINYDYDWADDAVKCYALAIEIIGQRLRIIKAIRYKVNQRITELVRAYPDQPSVAITRATDKIGSGDATPEPVPRGHAESEAPDYLAYLAEWESGFHRGYDLNDSKFAKTKNG